jgi:PGF-pre-PGF domain-containing protein
MIAHVTPITDSESANRGRGMMKASRNIRTKLCSMAVLIAVVAVMFAISITPAMAGTSGTQITTCTELQDIRNDLTGDYYLANDIDCSGFDYDGDGKGFMPIGNSSSQFTGTFDGKGYKITNLYINRSSTNYVGLFGRIDSVSEIKDVGLEEVDVNGSSYVGGLVGLNSFRTITNCYSTGSVTGSGSSYVGGLVGYNDGTITNSSSYCSVTGSGSSYVGGLVGNNYFGTITNSFSTGGVTGSSNIGGLVGYNADMMSNGVITNCYSTGSVSGSSNIGGLVGYNGGEEFMMMGGGVITNCYSTGSVSGSSNIGGLVGYNGGTITNSYWDIYRSGRSNCVDSASGEGCTGKNADNSEPDYWYYSTHTPMDNWDFTNIWAIEEGVTYPYLQWQEVAVDNTPPTITISSPQDGQIYNTVNVALNVSADETIDTWLYNINGTGNVTFPPNVTLPSLPDGDHNVTVFANDSAGNMGSAMVNFSVDTTPPFAPKITMPSNGATLNISTIWVNGTISDDTINVTVYVNGSITNESVEVSGTSYNIPNVPLGTDGVYEINVSAMDAVGNINSTNATAIVTVDAIPPIATFESPTPANNSNLSQNYININVTVAETNLKNVTTFIYYGTNLVNSNVSTSSPLLYNFTGLANGMYCINATAYDIVGNSNVTETRTILIDTIAPIATFVSPTPADNSNLTQNYIETNVTVAEINLKNVTTSIYNGTGLVTSIVNTSLPYYNNITDMDDGTYYINATAYDLAGNSNVTETRTILIDTTSPIATFESPTPANNSNKSQNYIDINVTVVETNLKNVTTYLFNSTSPVAFNVSTSSPLLYNFTNLDDGTYYINATAYDIVGNSNITETITILIDATKPVATFVSPTPADNSNLSQNYIETNVTVDETNLKNVTTSIYNGTDLVTSIVNTSLPYYNNITGLADGTYYINATAYDLAGNSNVTETITILIDTTSPIATLISPTLADNSNLSQNYIETNVTVDETNLKNVTTYLYNSTGLVNSNLSMSLPASYNFTGLTDGTYYINATAYDLVGNSNVTETITILIDTTKPVATFVSPTPADNSNLSQNYIETNVTVDETNLKNVTTSIYNGTDLVTSIVNTSLPYYNNITGLADGTYYINATAYDLAGNSNVTETITILIDTTSPIATLISPTLADNSNLSQNYIETNVTVDETNLKNVTTYLYNSTGLVSSNLSMSLPASYNFTGLTDGTYYINATAYDLTGNSNTTKTRTILLDTVPPNAPTINVPIDSEILASADTWVNGTIDANTTNVTVYVDGTIKNASVAVSGTFNISNVPLGADGVREINVSSKDAAGNVNTTNATVTVTVDTTPPTAPTNLIHTDDAPSGYDNDNSTNISWTASSDTYSSVIYRIYRDGILNASITSTNYTFTNETEGTHEYNVSANDSAGNINTTNATVTVIIDYTDPVIHNVSLSDTSPGYGQEIVVSVNVTDVISNITSVTAGSTQLTYRSGMLWNGTITAGYGTNTVTVIAYDNASNNATNASISYTGPDEPSSGGSSSVGGIGTSDEPENVDETVVLRIYLQAGESSNYNFNNVVTSVDVTPDKTYGLVAAKIEVLKGQPGSITTDPPAGEIYKYVDVFVGTSGWSKDKFSSSVINFQIPASWFEENNIDPASVTLCRHNNGEWQSLTTTLTRQAGGFYKYSSPTPGFSTFMILGQVEESSSGEPAAATDSGTVADPTPTPETTSDKGIPGFGILTGIMGILIAVYSRKK